MPSKNRVEQLMKRARDEDPRVVDRVTHLVHVMGMTNGQCAKEMSTDRNYIRYVRMVYNITLPDGRWHRFHPVGGAYYSRRHVVVDEPYMPNGRQAGQLEQLMDREKHLLCPEFAKWLQRACVLLAMLPIPASAHDWYSSLRTAQGGSCCNGKDCREVAECITADKREGLVLTQGTCSPVDYSKVLKMPSPDGKTHACTGPSIDPPGVAVRCIVRGASA